MKIRYNDFEQLELSVFEEQLQPALACAPAAVADNEANGVAETELSALYINLLPKEMKKKHGKGMCIRMYTYI